MGTLKKEALGRAHRSAIPIPAEADARFREVLGLPESKGKAHPGLVWLAVSGAVRAALLDGELGGDYYAAAPLEIEVEFLAPLPLGVPIIGTATNREIEEDDDRGPTLVMEVEGRLPRERKPLFQAELLWTMAGRDHEPAQPEKRSLPPGLQSVRVFGGLPHLEMLGRSCSNALAEIFREDDPVFSDPLVARQAGFQTRLLPWSVGFALFAKLGAFLAQGEERLRRLSLEFLSTPYAVPTAFLAPLDGDARAVEGVRKDGRVVARAGFEFGLVQDPRQRIASLGKLAADDPRAMEELVHLMEEGNLDAVAAFQEAQRTIMERVDESVEEGRKKAQAMMEEADRKKEEYARKIDEWKAEHPDEPLPPAPEVPPAPEPKVEPIPLPPEVARFAEGIPEDALAEAMGQATQEDRPKDGAVREPPKEALATGESTGS